MRYAFHIALVLTLLCTAGIAAWSQQAAFTSGELDELLGPIALYPDPLLAQILPAATYPDQLRSAYDLVQFQGGSGMIDSQPWDVSVRAVAHYPDVLRMMATTPDWTIAVGQAYVNQPDGVMKSIQRLRGRARLMGYLNSNSYQTVTASGGYISIVPAQPQYIYVPTYNPGVVYVQRRPSYGSSVFAFGAGLLIGAWLNNSINWNNNRVYYHGWNGGGWIGRSRPRVQINNPHYVNRAWANRAAPINRDIRTRDITNYRKDIKRNTGKYAPPGLIAPVRPSVPTKPATPSTRPVRPGVRPVPGVVTPKPGVPTTRPGGIAPRPVTPVVPGAGPSVPTTRPGKRPAVRVPRTVTPTTPGAPTVRPGTRPSGGAVRTAPSTRPTSPTIRPGTRPSGGAVRTAPSTKQASPRTSPKPRAGKDKKNNARGGGG